MRNANRINFTRVKPTTTPGDARVKGKTRFCRWQSETTAVVIVVVVVVVLSPFARAFLLSRKLVSRANRSPRCRLSRRVDARESRLRDRVPDRCRNGHLRKRTRRRRFSAFRGEFIRLVFVAPLWFSFRCSFEIVLAYHEGGILWDFTHPQFGVVFHFVRLRREEGWMLLTLWRPPTRNRSEFRSYRFELKTTEQKSEIFSFIPSSLLGEAIFRCEKTFFSDLKCPKCSVKNANLIVGRVINASRDA